MERDIQVAGETGRQTNTPRVRTGNPDVDRPMTRAELERARRGDQ